MVRYSVGWGTNSTSWISGKPAIRLRIPLRSPTVVECRETSNVNPPGRWKAVAYPPGLSCCSRTRALKPCRAKAAAQLSPPSPEPTITASHRSGSAGAAWATGKALQSSGRLPVRASADRNQSLLFMGIVAVLTIRRQAEMVQDHSVSNRESPDGGPGIGDGRRSCETILGHEAALGIDVGIAGARAGPVAGALDGAFGSRNRGHVTDAGIAGRGSSAGPRRQRHRCGDRGQRHAA